MDEEKDYKALYEDVLISRSDFMLKAYELEEENKQLKQAIVEIAKTAFCKKD